MTDSSASSQATEWWQGSAAWSLLDEEARKDLAVLMGFVSAVRAVADHPALSIERKEQALAALAAPLGGQPVATGDAGWAAPARALADLLAARGIENRLAWQVLQAAGQDLRKTRYRDWSDLLTWCRFAAAPIGQLAMALLGAPADKRAQSIAIAWQLTDIVARAGSRHRWLGRVYLPERWFAEAHGYITDLGFQRISPALKAVRARALDQAKALADEAKGVARALPGWRRRAAARAVVLQLYATIAALAREDSIDGDRRAARFIHAKAILWAILARP